MQEQRDSHTPSETTGSGSQTTRSFDLQYLSLDEITDEDLQLIEACRSYDPDFVSTEDIVEMASRGETQIWRFRGGDGSYAVFVTKILRGREFDTLLIWRGAGKWMMKWGDEINQSFNTFAKEYGCRFMRTVSRDFVAEEQVRKGWSALGVVLAKEVE